MEEFQKWRIRLGEGGYGVDGADFDLGERRRGGGDLEVLHGGKDEARIKGGEVEGKGFVAYGDGKKIYGSVDRDKKKNSKIGSTQD